ncbi:MAG: GspE/PulE family protein [Bacteroidota bacterium]
MDQLNSKIISPEILKLIPKKTAIEFCVLPLSVSEQSIEVGLPEKYDQEIVNDLSFLLSKKITVLTFPREILFEAIQRNYDISTLEMNKESSSKGIELLSVKENSEGKTEATSDGSVVLLANKIITEAIQLNASDIHVEPYEKLLRVRTRLDGVLHELMTLPVAKSRPLISRLKIMADLDIAERRRPQDGRIRVKQNEKTIDIRVSTLPTDFGEKIVLRILDKSHLNLQLTNLGFEENDLALFQKTLHLPYGMILVTGPTGSGKTTTLYGALNYINDSKVNITTIEDPIEYNLPGINQTHVHAEIGLTFANVLRSILRQDPNVIMLGEIRDYETAEIAVRAALTGHLVLSTLHTNDSLSAVTRLIDMGVEPFLVSSSVRLIIAQRLLRKICPHCKEQYHPSKEELTELGIRENGAQYFKGKGCSHCLNSGYKGRTATYEMLNISAEMSELIVKRSSAKELHAQAHLEGFTTIRQNAILKAQKGETTLYEVLRETAV